MGTTDRVGDRRSQLLFSTATQYYVVGRYAVQAHQIPVAGNLLHHAVELFLKGGLAKRAKTLKQLRAFSHSLPGLWAAFKVAFPDQALRDCDSLVKQLHDFEELRYPDSTLAKGLVVTIGMTRSVGATSGTSGVVHTPTYVLYVEDIDALVDKVFAVSSVNPDRFFSHLTNEARDALRAGNTRPWAR